MYRFCTRNSLFVFQVLKIEILYGQVPGVIISGEAGKGKSYLMKLVQDMLFKGQVRTVHRASACAKDEDVGQCVEIYHEAAPQAMNKSSGKNDNDQARANFKATLTERKFAVKTKDAKTRSVYTETFINMAVPFMCMNESEDKIEPAVLDRFLRLVSGFENGGKYARPASKVSTAAATVAAQKRMETYHDCVRVSSAMFNFLNADETFNQERCDNPLLSWVLTKWEDAMPSIAGVAGASPRWTNHVSTFAKVFRTMSAVTALQLGLVFPPCEGFIHHLEDHLKEGDSTSNQYKAVQDLKQLDELSQSGADYMDVLGTCGAKLVLEVINFELLDAIFYGFATLVDGSTSRRDKEAIEGIKSAVYNCDALGDYIKTPYGLDALVGNVVTVLNNRKTRRESKTVMGAIHEIQNRLVGKDEKSKTQAMITHNPREVLVHRSLMGECLTPEEKNMLNTLSHKSFCHKPALLPSDIKNAISGHKYRKIEWVGWNTDNSIDIKLVSPSSFIRVNPEHFFVNKLSPDGSGDESSYSGCMYVSDKLFQMARDERDEAAGITVGLSRLLKVFNTDDKWGKVCIPAHPNDNSLAFALINKKTDHTKWKVKADMRVMENCKHVPEKRRKLLPGVVKSMIENEENIKFTKIEPGQDLQSCVAKMHLMKSTLGREIMDGPGDGQAMLDKIFQDWLSPIAIQTDLNDLA